MWPSEASSGVFTIPQLHSYKPSGTELPTEQLIRDDIWRAATDTRSTALYTDTTNHTWQSNKTDAFISAYAVNPREKHSCASNSRTLATPRSWLWFPRNYELIKRTPLMQYKPLGIKVANKCKCSCLWTNTHKNSAVDFHRNHCTDWNPCFWSSSQFSA